MASATVVEPEVLAASRPEEPLYEVVNGQRVDLPPICAYATWILARLQNRLGPFAEERALGTVVPEMLFILDVERDLRRRPDVAFVSAERWPLDRPLPETGDWAIVPNLAVEVISPHDVSREILVKLEDYFRYGVQLVWVIYPEPRLVYIYESFTDVRILTAEDTLNGGDVIPGFELPLTTLFQRSATPVTR